MKQEEYYARGFRLLYPLPDSQPLAPGPPAEARPVSTVTATDVTLPSKPLAHQVTLSRPSLPLLAPRSSHADSKRAAGGGVGVHGGKGRV